MEKTENKLLDVLSLQRENDRLRREIEHYQSKCRTAECHSDSDLAPNLRTVIAAFVHDLKNQNVLIGVTSSKVMERAFPPEKLQGKIQRIQTASKYIHLLLCSLVSYMKGGEIVHSDLYVRDILEEAIALIEYRTPSNIELNIEAPSNYFPQVFGNKEQIEQVLIKVCENGIEAMPSGGSLTIRIAQTVSEDRKFVKFSIEDTGIGISKDNLNKIFNLNFSTKREGWGMGLYLCKDILKDMGGEISANSTEGKGTTVTLLFPEAIP
jgi:signal transduction histidine kinase